MKKIKSALMYLLVKIAKMRLLSLILALIIILLSIKIATNNMITSQDTTNTDFNDNSNIATGNISTSVEKNEKLSDNISVYELEDGFSEIDDEAILNNKNNNSTTTHNQNNNSSNTESYYTDYSSLTAGNTTILEGEFFDPIKDLKLNATDRNGNDISSKINIEESNVNRQKPGYYEVRASVKLNNGEIVQKRFTVNVQAVDLEVAVNSFKPVEEEIKKGEDIIFDLDINSSKSYVKVNAVSINGKEYSVYKGDSNGTVALSNTQKYKVKVQSRDLAGIHEYKLSYIRMSDGTLINLNNTAILETLKSEAKVKDFKYKNQPLQKRILANFKIEDVDNSASNLRMEVYKNGQLLTSEKLDKKEEYEEYIYTYTNGTYEIKVLADINLYSSTDKDNTIFDKEIFVERIKINNVDESSIDGNDVELEQGDSFEIKSLNIKATDVNGEDITKDVVVSYNNVDTNVAGKYIVKVYVINNNGRKIERTFNVRVNEVVENENINDYESSSDDELQIQSLDEAEYASYQYGKSRSLIEVNVADTYKNSRSLIDTTVSGNDTEQLNANVTVTGNVFKADGTAAAGKLHVEVPTRLSFSVDQSGNFNSGIFIIKNQSSTAISVSVGQFTETKINSGITVRPLSEDLTNKDRSNVHLYLQGDTQIDLGDKSKLNQELVAINPNDSKAIQLLGSAGKGAGTEVDNNGASEEFMLVFKIKKKS